MKMILLAITVWTFTTAIVHGQIAGSAEARSNIQKYLQRMAEMQAKFRKNLESGRSLFGADKRWTTGEGELAGTLAGKHPSDFKVGDWGCTLRTFQILNNVSKSECLVLPMGKGTEVMLIRGLDMSKATDGVQFILQHPVAIQETYSYTTVGGSQKTVLVLDCSKDKIDKLLESARKAAEDAQFRDWAYGDGRSLGKARFIEFKNSRVWLERRDGSKVEVASFRLSREDQKWVRDELKRRRDEKRKAAAKKAKKKKSRR